MAKFFKKKYGCHSNKTKVYNSVITRKERATESTYAQLPKLKTVVSRMKGFSVFDAKTVLFSKSSCFGSLGLKVIRGGSCC